MRADIGKLRRGLASPKPPKDITQEPYMGNPRHLRRLARGDWRTQLPEPGDLFAYVEDINYVEVVQPGLFRYMLPVLLEMWRQDLMRENRDNGHTVEWLYMALAGRRPVKTLLGDKAEEAAGAFMRDAILDRMDEANELVGTDAASAFYDWIGAVAGLGAMFPVIESLWQAWWRIETRGQAIALLQYACSLIYDDADNLLFQPWTPEAGGGPPCLWDPAGHIYDQGWLPANVEFLRETLTADYVEDGVRRAVETLRGDASPDLLDRLVADLPDRRPVLEWRVFALPEILSTRLDQFIDWDAAAVS